jgi:hypothetical protein
MRNDVDPRLIQRWEEVYTAKYREDPKEAQKWYSRLDDKYKPVFLAHMKRSQGQ